MTMDKEFERLCNNCIFYQDKWEYDDPYETRYFATEFFECNPYVGIVFDCYWFDLKEPFYRSLGRQNRRFVPNRDQTQLFWVPDQSLRYTISPTINIDDMLQKMLPNLSDKTIAINLSDKDDLTVSLVKTAAKHLKELYLIQKNKGYKPGWVYYRFKEYEFHILEKRQYSFRDLTYDPLRTAADSYLSSGNPL